MDRRGRKKRSRGSFSGAVLYSQKIRHFPIIMGTESNKEACPLPILKDLPCKGKEHSKTREVKESDLIPPEHPELKVTVT